MKQINEENLEYIMTQECYYCRKKYPEKVQQLLQNKRYSLLHLIETYKKLPSIDKMYSNTSTLSYSLYNTDYNTCIIPPDSHNG